MTRRPTVYDVAERVGVSIATVSHVFRKPQRVRPETRQAVLRAARELGYVRSASARSLAEGATGAFGMYAFDLMLSSAGTVPDDTLVAAAEDTLDPRVFPLYVDEIERGFALECRSRDRALLLASGSPAGDNMYDIAGRVDGLALFPGPHEQDAPQSIAQSIPVVAFNAAVDDGPLSHIYVDNRVGIRTLVEHVATVHGVTDLAFVGDMSMPEFRVRLADFRHVCASLSLTPSTSDGRAALAGPDWREALVGLVATDRLPAALLCQNDQQALDVLDVLTAGDVPVPGRVVVTGFDGILAARLSSPTLTTIRQPMESMGRLAVRVLARQVADPTAPPVHHEMPLQPVFAESCGCG